MSILVLGTVALDTVKTPFGMRRQMLGGSAVHFAMSARLFTNVHLVSVIGKDFPQKHVDFLNKKGIILSSIRRTKGKTFKWEGRYQGDFNTAQTLNTELGVLLDFKPTITAGQKNIRDVFLANLDPEIQDYLLIQMRSPRLVGLDSMNFWIKSKPFALKRILKKVTIYVANDQEARDLSSETNLIKAAKKLHSLGPKIVLIKKGEHGVILYSDKFVIALPAYPVEKVIDPTGAGDTFAGGFMGYLARVKRIDSVSLKKALVWGTIAASFNVEDFGMKITSCLTVRELERRLLVFKQMVLF